jgi:two-component system, NtrC family, response regulator GlrR
VARCDVPVLIEGETGTGKELAARAIHYLSQRRNHPFIPVNCGAIPDNLVENELFGHERGAFTDAKETQIGLIGQAEGGTLFLDEIETLPAKAQAALLRFLQDRQYRPLGAKRSRQADLRVIAASNTDLDKLVSHGAFRQDLMFRLKIMWITLPPLRERAGDALFLAEHFLQQFCIEHELGPITLHPLTRDWIQRHCWPGNVRELENCILRELLLTETDQIQFGGSTPPRDRRAVTADRRFHNALAGRMRVLEATGGNVSEAARRAGKERRAFGKLLAKYGIARNTE